MRQTELPRPALEAQTRPRQRPTTANHKSLLLGTALATTLLLAPTLMPAPASAYQNEFVSAQDFDVFFQSGIIVGDLTQPVSVTHFFPFPTQIGGTVTPAGVVGEIDNLNVQVASGIALIVGFGSGSATVTGSATTPNAAPDATQAAGVMLAGSVGGDLTQTASGNQVVTVTSGIAIDSAGLGVAAGISNQDLSFAKGIGIAVVNGGDIAGNLSQSASANQANALSNEIDIVRGAGSGGLVVAQIDNQTIAHTNAAGVAMLNGDGIATVNASLLVTVTPASAEATGRAQATSSGPGSVGQDAIQSAQIDQAYTFKNRIGIDNAGGSSGIAAGINNQTIVAGNMMIARLLDAGAAAGNATQSFKLKQTNALASEIDVANSGQVRSSGFGISAEIDNREVGLVHFGAGSVEREAAAGDVSQSSELDQTGGISARIGIASSGSVQGSSVGIGGKISNDNITFSTLVGSLGQFNGGDIDGDLTQQARMSQANAVDSRIGIANSGSVQANGIGLSAEITNRGIQFLQPAAALAENQGAIGGDLTQSATITQTNSLASHIDIENSGSVRASGIGVSAAITNSAIAFTTAGGAGGLNSGVVSGEFSQAFARTVTNSIESTIAFANSGAISGGDKGVFASIVDPAPPEVEVRSRIGIVNSGSITADSLFAIDTEGASTTIRNFGGGTITGFVDLTDRADLFLNQSGGVFETKLVSDFGGGSDLFRNEGGGTVQAATDPGAREHSAFVNLERFENTGLISLQDGAVGDTFEISNTVGQRDLAFAASSGSTLGVDAFLGGPGSQADNFIVNGNITGRTALAVHNTNPGAGALGAIIPVVYANGDVKADAFFLPQPIDTGFFDYDLFFRPTGSGIFELRSFLGAGAFVLPQLTTAAQDLWYAGSSTWFDRTADLRVLLAGGAAPLAYAPTGSKLDDGVQAPGAVPAVWMRGSGSWLDRDDSASVTAYGRTYQYNLDRELETFDFQVGLDLGTRDVLGSGDILVFGALGGFVHGDLGYEQIARSFDLSGGQVGGYATYLNGGLFVDTLLNAHFLEVDTPVLGFPGSLDATTIGLRTDAGYRFGSFTGGAFIEPLATIAVTWADLDGFSVGGNTVSFDDDANVRGRLGLRAGTSYAAWEGVVMEPFVIGSVWGNLSGDTNSATLTSTGTTFLLNDQLDDVWGEVSAGVNFFNFSSGTTLFAKVDVTFGDDISGVGGKLGMRVAW